MKKRPSFPLLAKVLAWLLLHLLLLALAFAAFVGWQLRLGLDSLLSGAAGDRLRAFGEVARAGMIGRPPGDWSEAIAPLAEERDVTADIFDAPGSAEFQRKIPANVIERLKTAMPTQRPGPPPRREPPPGEDFPPPGDFPEGRQPSYLLPATRPAFLLKGDGGDGYWAGIHIPMPGSRGRPPRQQLLLVRSDRLDGSGMFFDFKPWLWGGFAMLALSLAFWTPLVLGITRYLRRLTIASGEIASGHFEITVPKRGDDELGRLGKEIQTMARLDLLVGGQKRFLGDAAHELCAPLARLRTGLGILEMKLGPADASRIASIESDAADLASLVEEILAFSRAGNRSPRCQRIAVDPLVREISARDGAKLDIEIDVSPDLSIMADPALVARALGNLIRNASIHAGSKAHVSIKAREEGDRVLIAVTDNGPGVAAEELPRLFEPFYRPDRSRTRETGGNGLGLAIVKTSILSCGGEVEAMLPRSGGFQVLLTLHRWRELEK